MTRKAPSLAVFETLVSRVLESERSREFFWKVILKAWSVDHRFEIPQWADLTCRFSGCFLPNLIF